jgi:hypothetical protein
MVDADIKIGDVVHDLVEGGAMVVVDRPADSVADLREREDFDLAGYKAHPLLDVTDDDAVFTCVYIPSQPTASFSGTYDFPEARLARVPVEAANQDLGRVQRGLTVAVLEALFDRAYASGNEGLVEDLDAIAGEAFGAELAHEGRELAEAARFGEGED